MTYNKGVFNMNMKNKDFFEYYEPNTIEILGYAKNKIVDVKEKEKKLPAKYRTKLSKAYALLDEVQDYLFER